MNTQMMTRKATAKDTENKLKTALLELKKYKADNNMLLKERSDCEGEIEAVNNKVLELKRQLTELHIEYMDVLDQRDRLEEEVRSFSNCSDVFSRSLSRSTELEASLNEAHTKIISLEQTIQVLNGAATQNLYSELLGEKISTLHSYKKILSAEKVQHRTTEIDLVLEGLRDQRWSLEEQACLDQTLFTLNNAKNYTVWAMSIWNSMHHPVGSFYGAPYSLGHYDQCLQAPTKAVDVITQYCLADVKLTSSKHKWEDRNVMGDTEAFLGTRTDMNRNLSKITWGVCLPAVCKPGSAAKILKTIYMVNPLMSAEPSIEIENCQVAGAKRVFSTGFYAFVTLVFVLVSAAIFSTIYVQIADPTLTITHIATCFCLKRNWLSLTKTSTSDDISSLNYLKVMAAFFCVIAHSFLFSTNGPIGNVLYFDWLMVFRSTDYYVKNVVRNVVLINDVFFAMSGILLIKGLMTTKKHPLVSLASRYFRLIGSFALVTFYVAAVSIHTGDGPLWHKLAGREQKAASDSWLWSLLMLNNYVNSENITQMVAWYIPCDYQFAIMGTIIFMLWQKDYRLGKMVTILVSVLAMLIPAVVTYWTKLPGSPIFEDIEKLKDIRSNEVFLETYIKSYHRAGPYLLGMGMGYFMTVYKPVKYRECISQKLSLFLFIAACLTGFKELIAAPNLKNDHFGTAVNLPFQRLMFSLSSCIWIVVVEYGNMPYLRNITKFHGLTVLSRLTYGIYLTHSLFLQQSAFSRKFIKEFGILQEVTYTFGVFCLSALVAVLLWLFVEAPLNNLVNLVSNPESVSLAVRDSNKIMSKDKL